MDGAEKGCTDGDAVDPNSKRTVGADFGLYVPSAVGQLEGVFTWPVGAGTGKEDGSPLAELVGATVGVSDENCNTVGRLDDVLVGEREAVGTWEDAIIVGRSDGPVVGEEDDGMVEMLDGSTEGEGDGKNEGALDGLYVRCGESCADGIGDSTKVGSNEGDGVGKLLGFGEMVGWAVGRAYSWLPCTQ